MTIVSDVVLEHTPPATEFLEEIQDVLEIKKSRLIKAAFYKCFLLEKLDFNLM